MQPITRSRPIVRARTPPGSRRDRSGRGRPFSGTMVEIPPRNAVHREDDAGRRAEQRRDRRGRLRQGRGFQRDKDDILHPELLRPVGGVDARVVAFVADPQGQAAFADRVELGAAPDRRDLDAGRRRARPEPRRDMTADRAGAENRYLHRETVSA